MVLSNCSLESWAPMPFNVLTSRERVTSVCLPELEALVNVDFATFGCSYHFRRDRLKSSGLFVTSTNAGSWAASRAFNFKYTPLHTQLPSPLVFYHEASISSPFPLPSPNSTELSSLCMVDLFDAWPSFARLITKNHSCVDAFYSISGRVEPFEGILRIPSGKVLARKVAALYHAAMGVDDATPVMWLDWDTTYRPQSNEIVAKLWQHVSARDVTLLPFRHWDRNYLRCTHAVDFLDDPSLTIDTGLLGISRGPASVRFLWRLMQHYDGGAAYLRHACACCDTASTSTGVKVERSCRSRSRGMSLAQTKKYATGQVVTASGIKGGVAKSAPRILPCGQPWFKHNLFLDDLFVWTLHVLWEQIGIDVFEDPIVERDGSSLIQRAKTQVRFGWFGTGRKHDRGTNLGRCTWQGQPWISACPGANEVTSSFDVQSIFRHFVASFGEAAGPYTKVSRQKVAVPTEPYLQFPPQAIVDSKWCSRNVDIV